MNVSRSGYYQWTRRKESERKKRRAQLKQQISRIFLESRRLYGSPKIAQVSCASKASEFPRKPSPVSCRSWG
ncbi:hypothetical protein ABE228_08570, partial [Cohnella laeviribosi]